MKISLGAFADSLRGSSNKDLIQIGDKDECKGSSVQ